MRSFIPKLYILSLFVGLAIFTAGCGSDEFNLLNPQEVTLFVDHYSGNNNPGIFLYPNRQPAPLSLRGFEERQLGYTYRVKAKVYVPGQPAMDGPNRWFKFIKVISEERYTGNKPFEISLLQHHILGSGLGYRKREGTFLYGSYELRPATEEISKQLDELSELRSKFEEDPEYVRQILLKAIVRHDPENRGEGYLVHEIVFVD
ncbi:hypothetical protein [Fodinibius salsisoli]|uniref:DUF4377 domain-containing protein n=1 Tax=Fodinibius salsisoli TaxID=2820877 RepID=A0ABT3PRW9_9BACT|nr:hypothetical protein [Fodinibius salsisoli]MCW9708609.1 hypothetical protein [Fodinibius salsisoli]